jgi:DEAD/DEAH box helicase domain-containing protein
MFRFKNPVTDDFLSSGGKIIDTVWVDMPPYENTTTGMWIDLSKQALNFLGSGAAAAIHAAAHAFLNQFPMAGDLRTECPVPQKETSKKESSRKRPGRYVLYSN